MSAKHSIVVTKHDQRGKIVAQTVVDTIEQARAFLDSLNPDGSPKAALQPAAPSQPTPCQQQQCNAAPSTAPSAALIAAAPELLAALQRCVAVMEQRCPEASPLPDARAAIAKATGADHT